MDRQTTTQDRFERNRLPELNNVEAMNATYQHHVYPRHFHDYYVIQVVEKGINSFYCEGQTHVARAGTIVLINPGEVHTGWAVGDTPLTYHCLYPTVDQMLTLTKQIERPFSSPPLFNHHVVRDKPLAATFLTLLRSFRKNNSTLHLQGEYLQAIYHLLSRYSTSDRKDQPIRTEHIAVTRARNYLTENSADKISLDSLAQVSGLSQYHLLRTFRRSIGLTPGQYQTNIRLERARKLLCKRQGIASVAYEVGFYDQSHLNRCFKGMFGVTPGQYQKH